jgi:hypothetical protein
MAKSDSTGLILLAVGGAAAYYAYTQGWLSSITSLFGSSAAPALLPVTAAPVVSTTTVPPTVVSTPVYAPAAPAAPIPPPTLAPTQSVLLSTLQAAASNPGNAALSTNGGQTYSGYQWDAIAKSVLGPGYQPMSLLPSIQGGTQYTIQQYLTAYPSTGGVSGLGRTVVYFPRRGARVVLGRNYHMRRA